MSKGKLLLLLGVAAAGLLVGAVAVAKWRRRRPPEHPDRPVVVADELNGGD